MIKQKTEFSKCRQLSYKNHNLQYRIVVLGDAEVQQYQKNVLRDAEVQPYQKYVFSFSQCCIHRGMIMGPLVEF